MTESVPPRPLSSEERVLVEFILRADFPGSEKLREQIDSVEVVGRCECGCGTVNLRVRGASDNRSVEGLLPAEAHGEGVDVLLFARAGFLSCLELVFHDDRLPRPFPSPRDLRLVSDDS